MPASAVTIQNQGNGTALVSTRASPGLTYPLQSSPDLQTWTTIAAVPSGTVGACAQPVSVTTPAFYRYAYQPPVP